MLRAAIATSSDSCRPIRIQRYAKRSWETMTTQDIPIRRSAKHRNAWSALFRKSPVMVDKEVGIVPTDVQMGLSVIPADFNPRPKTNPTLTH